MSTDSLLAAIRKARHDISQECGHDPYQLVAYYKARKRRLDTEAKQKSVEHSPQSPTMALQEKPDEYRSEKRQS